MLLTIAEAEEELRAQLGSVRRRITMRRQFELPHQQCDLCAIEKRRPIHDLFLYRRKHAIVAVGLEARYLCPRTVHQMPA